MFYLVVIVIALTRPDAWPEPLDAALLMTDADRSATASPTSRIAPGGGRAGPSSTRCSSLWAIVCIFPIYWTITTSFKQAPDVMQGNLVPFLDFEPAWLGWRSLGLSPETIGCASTVRDEFLTASRNSLIVSVTASALAVAAGLADRVRPVALRLPVRLHAQRRHLVLLHQPAHPAPGRAGAAVPGPVQAARPASTRTWASCCCTP